MFKKLLFLFCLAAALAATAQKPVEMPIKIGVRAGFNTATMTGTRLLHATDSRSLESHFWQQGFTAGCVVAIPFTRYFALQPGFFVDVMRSSYRAIGNDLTGPSPQTVMARNGQVTTTDFQVPVLFSFRLQPWRNFEVQLNAGPWGSIGIGGRDRYTATDFTGQIPDDNPVEVKEQTYGYDGLLHRLNWGFKLGAGFLLWKHYYIGAHYLAGCRNIAMDKERLSKARSKEWQFTIGYNF